MHNFRVQIIGPAHVLRLWFVLVTKMSQTTRLSVLNCNNVKKENSDKVSNSGEKWSVHIIQITLWSPCTVLVRFQLTVNSDK